MHEDIMQMKEDYIREIVKLYREKGLNKDTIELFDTLVHTAKNLCKIVEGEENNMYSMRGRNSYGGMSYDSYSNYSNDGMNSYARGRGANANRDSMGRYSSLGYSGHDDMVNGLRDLMNRTHDEATRRELQDMVNRYQ